MRQSVSACINELNEKNFYSKTIKNSFFKRGDIFSAIVSVKNYENEFYKKQQNYTKSQILPINRELLPFLSRKSVKSADSMLDCWDLNKNCSQKYIIFFGGIGTDKSSQNAQNAYKIFLENGYGVLAFDYSGCGKSSGVFSKKNIEKNANSVYKYLTEKGIKPQNIGIVAHSMGSAAALSLCARKNSVAFLVLLNPFNKASDMVRVIAEKLDMPEFVKNIIKKLPSVLLPIKNRFDNEKYFQKTTIPVQIIHNRHDNVIPVELCQKLCYSCCKKNNVEYIELSGNDHEINEDKVLLSKNFVNKVFANINF